ncbi:UDP-N-acetylglucosamine 4,6-dehydratase (inverting) [Thalassospiraceae bacterium LMO-JJ14]|nr:UDP-N-acetylglucosamine 4,6-dehydratase (inverting) [Thalassospiraceae bacterium LMO-JJ14]
MPVNFDGSSVLVVGGTGSFGQVFVKTILERYSVNRLIVFSRDELKQYEMSNRIEFRGRPEMRYFIGDVRDANRLNFAMREVDYVIHAAALKHVPAAEYNPSECILTNIIGAQNVIQAALSADVKKVIALSTDKACNPINLYGATKLASDKLFAAANNLAGGRGTRFSVVRYGNVIGSRGSIIPYFKQLIDEGAEALPITDPRMTRFWISLQQGVDFVIDMLGQMTGGEVFVPKIPSMNIVDLAHAVAPDMPHKIVGIRPGEKLHEIMISSDDSKNVLDCGSHYIIKPSFAFWDHVLQDPPGSQPVPEGFNYTSNGNTEWLDEDHIRNILSGS